MKNFLLLFIFLCSFSSIHSQDLSATKIYHDDGGEKIYHHSEVDESAMFKRGEKEMYKFIGRNLDYPKQARKEGVSGRVYISFIVEVDGSVTNAKVIKGIGELCDNEAKRVIESFPDWYPAKVNSKAVRSQYNMPIKFSLD